MSQFPAEPPDQSLSHDDLQTIAGRQKGIIVCILIYLLALPTQFLLPEELRALLGLGVGVVMIVGAVFVFLLATKLYGTGLGVLLGILALIPLLGLIVLLIVNGKATNTLKSHGIAVGLLGAKPPVP